MGAVAVLVLAAGLLFFALGEITGLHGDEAWVMLAVSEISGGARPVNAMNAYTGPLHLYLLAPFFEVFGHTPGVLRAWAAVMGMVTAALSMAVASELFPDRGRARWVGFLFVTSPAFVLYSRFGTDISAFLPALQLGGVYLVLRSSRFRGARSGLAAVTGGAFLGLAGYTHILALSLPAGVGLALLAVRRGALVREPRAWLALLGIALGLLPRALFSASATGAAEWQRRLSWIASADFVPDLAVVPEVLLGILDGSLLYQRFVGENLLPVFPYAGILLAALLVARAAQLRRAPPTELEVTLALVLGLTTLLVALVTPQLSLRYFLAVALGVPFLAVALAGPTAGASPTFRRVVAGLLTLQLACNLTYLVGNYFVAFSRSGGTASLFAVGERLVETSSHFLPTRGLYDSLVARGVRRVYAPRFVAWSLRAHDLEDRALDVAEALPSGDEPISEPFAIVHVDGPTLDGLEIVDMSDRGELRVGDVILRPDRSYAPHFVVFTTRPESRSAVLPRMRRSSRRLGLRTYAR